MQRSSLPTKPSLLKNGADGKGSVSSSSGRGGPSFSNGKPNPDGFTGKSPISTISIEDHGNLYHGMRPLCRIRPTSAVIQGSSVAHINRLQGELVRKRKECEELKKQNKCLSNELHLERIFMKSENELGMRNLRNLNHGLQATVKELKHKLNASQQNVAKYSKLAEEASLAQAEAEKNRAEAEVQKKLCQEQQEAVQLENLSLKDETQQLKRKLTEMQQLLAQVEKSHFESQLKLERITMEREVISKERRYLEHERNELKQKLKGTMEENSKCKENEISQRCRTEAAEEALEKATLLHYEAERRKCLLECEKEEKEKQCEIWMKKYNSLAELLHSQEEDKSKRQNKAVCSTLKSISYEQKYMMNDSNKFLL
ncbi:hypothetical protein JD844_021763 [Phrynosoma platyrhinos]|uniref:Uncharacterized protein n=1 Tax=Phrynosoma platyrhinos TaxID=52577 RepID=A0ABQ7SU99_PHRPL|nr:hypothetical protein JD844_021763 [Phrynosoma platyrhinos]